MYACVRTDNMSGTTLAKDLASAKYFVGGDEKEIENGNIVAIGEYIDGEREVRKATAPKANTKLSELFLVATPEVKKDSKFYSLGEYRNEAGAIIRGYRLVSGDIYSVTAEALDGTAKVGAIVEAQASTKAKVVDVATESSTVIGTIRAIEGKWIVIEVA